MMTIPRPALYTACLASLLFTGHVHAENAIGVRGHVGCREDATRVNRLQITKPGIYENYLVDSEWAGGNRIKITADNATLRNCEIRNATGNGIGVFGKKVTIENCKIHHLLNSTFDQQHDAHGVTGRWSNVTIRNCEVYYVSGDCVQFDPDRKSMGRVLIENCTFWTGPLPADAAGFSKGERPGENGFDSKTPATGPRCELTIRNCLMYGWKQPGQIGNMAAINLKENVRATVERCLFRDNEISFRLRGPTGRGDALVTINNCAVFESAVGVRMEDNIRDLRIRNLAFGKGVERKYHMVGRGPFPGYDNQGEAKADSFESILENGWNAMADPDELVTKGRELLAKQRGPSGAYLTISDRDLFGSMDLERPGLEQVRSAASSGDYASAYAAWGRYWAERQEPVYYLDEADYTQEISQHLPKIREIVIDRADFIWSPDYQHSTYKPKRGGRTFQWVDDTVRDSAYIGLHYWWFGEYLGRAYLLTGDEKYPAMFRELVCSWWDDLPLLAAKRSDGVQVIWNSGLGSSIRSLAMVDGYYLMRKSPEFTDELHRKILRIFLGHSRYMLDTRLGAYNHWNGQATQCCWGAMAGILMPEFRDSGKWLDAAVRLTEQRVMENYDADGAQLEMCPQYHFAGMRDITRVVWMLARNNISDRLGDKAFRKKLERIYDFPIRLAHPTGHGAVMNSGVYGTEWLAFMPIGVQLFDSKLQAWAAKRFIEPDFVPVAKNISQYVLFMDSAWVRALDAAKETPLAEPGFRCDLLQHSGVAVLRSGWDRNALSMVFDFNTKPYGGHAYPGRLSFDLWAHGAALVVNPGSTLSYSMPEYRQWCHRTRGHNTVMVNNKDQSRPHYAKLLAWHDGKHATFVAASTDTYLKPQGVLHQRCILFVHGEYYFVFDRLVGGKAGTPLAWLLHSPKPLEERDDGTVSTPAGEPGMLIVPDSATQAASKTVFGAGYSAVPVNYHANYKPLDAWQDGAPILRLESAFDGTGANHAYGVLLVPFAASPPQATATRGISTSPEAYAIELDWGAHKDEILFDFQDVTPRFTLTRLDTDDNAVWNQGSVDRER